MQADAKASLMRVKMLANASLMYAGDFDGLFPYSQTTAGARLVVDPYVADKESFNSPIAGGSILYNVNIGGVSAYSLKPNEVPVWFEQLPNPSDAPAVGYVDGHVMRAGGARRAQFDAAIKQRYPRPKNSKPLSGK